MPQFRLLDSNYRMQQRPFGTNTALSNGTEHGAGGSFGSALRRQESGYGRALRILDRQARRGDANSALRAIDVRNQAMEQGMSPGILRNVDEKRGDVYGRMGAMERNRADSEMVRDLALQQAREELGVGTLNPKDMQLGSAGMAGNGTKVAQNGTSVPNTSRNVTTDRGVHGASGVQGATRVQGSPSLGSRLTSGWDRFKAGVTGAVDALTGKMPDVESPKAQEPVGKIDGRPAQEVLKEMRDRRERELGELPQYAPPKAIVVPESKPEDDLMRQAKAVRELGRAWDRAKTVAPEATGPPASAVDVTQNPERDARWAERDRQVEAEKAGWDTAAKALEGRREEYFNKIAKAEEAAAKENETGLRGMGLLPKVAVEGAPTFAPKGLSEFKTPEEAQRYYGKPQGDIAAMREETNRILNRYGSQKSKEPAVTSKPSSQGQIGDELSWLKPGIHVSEAKRTLTELHGYTPKQADELIKGRGVTDEAARNAGQSKILSRKERQAEIDARAKKEFEADVLKNPPKDLPYLSGSIANSVFQSLRDPGGIRRRTYQRLTQNQR